MHAFKAFDANTDMSRTDHVHVVCSVTDSHRNRCRMLAADHLYDLSFLFRRYTACKNYICFVDKTNELGSDRFIRVNLQKRIATDDNSHLSILDAEILLVFGNHYLLVDIGRSYSINDILVDFIIKQAT